MMVGCRNWLSELFVSVVVSVVVVACQWDAVGFGAIGRGYTVNDGALWVSITDCARLCR